LNLTLIARALSIISLISGFVCDPNIYPALRKTLGFYKQNRTMSRIIDAISTDVAYLFIC